MIKKIFRGIFTIVGGLVGYEIFELAQFLFIGNGGADGEAILSDGELTLVGTFFAIIFGIIFYNLAPALTREGKKVADNIENDIKGVSANDLIGGTIGLIAGFVIAYLLAQIYEDVLTGVTYVTVAICTYGILGYLGAVIGNKKLTEFFAASISQVRQQIKQTDIEENPYSGYNIKDKKKGAIPKILDTSVIIDGRIAEVMKTGFLEGPIVIPEFVLVELRHIADSSDGLKRNRGRRGLDILNKIQEEYGIEIYNTDSEKALKEIPEVDVKLLKLAQIMKGKVVTNDFNLNKVSAIKGVPVLNINELANAMKPMVIPGEVMTVTLIKPGKDPNQAIAYLDDGTMIVVEDGRRKIGSTMDINVTSVLQTAAGRMIFGKLRQYT